MSAITDKAKISGIMGVLGAVTAIAGGYTNMFLFAGFGLFFFTMMIQYGGIQFKIATSAAAILGFAYYLSQMGVINT